MKTNHYPSTLLCTVCWLQSQPGPELFYPTADPLLAQIASSIKKHETKQKIMKEVNAITKNKRMTIPEKILRITEIKDYKKVAFFSVLDLFRSPETKKQGFSQNELVTNARYINKLKKCFSLLFRKLLTPPRFYMKGNVLIREDQVERILELYFPQRPPKEIHAFLQVNNFQFKRKKKCYQSYLNQQQQEKVNYIVTQS